MLTELGLAFLAGLLTVLNPCVLPMLPLIVGGAVAEGRFAPVALAAGMVVSFTVFGVLITAFGHLVGLDLQTIRIAAAVLLLLAGLVLVDPRAQAIFGRIAAPLAVGANRFLEGRTMGGMSGQFSLGAMLGAVWSPCVGPTLGAAVALAARAEQLGQVTLTLAVFSTGFAAVFLFFAYGSRSALARRRTDIAAFGAKARMMFGWLMIIVAVMIITGFDKVLEELLLKILPASLVDLTTRF